ncbi:MAG TPA: hypothetical protein DIW67_20135 [Pseudomonas sp.]|nr:hypothetical protein [Pseudomonas sp.]
MPEFYGGCAQGTFGCAGILTSRSTNLRTAATLRLVARVSDSIDVRSSYPCSKSPRIHPPTERLCWRPMMSCSRTVPLRNAP